MCVRVWVCVRVRARVCLYVCTPLRYAFGSAQDIAHRIVERASKGLYDRHKWEKDFQAHLQYRARISRPMGAPTGPRPASASSLRVRSARGSRPQSAVTFVSASSAPSHSHRHGKQRPGSALPHGYEPTSPSFSPSSATGEGDAPPSRSLSLAARLQYGPPGVALSAEQSRATYEALQASSASLLDEVRRLQVSMEVLCFF